MRIAYLFFVTSFIAMAAAGSVTITEISGKVTAAFDQETGAFAEDAYETLLEAHSMIGEALEDEIASADELYVLGAVNSMVMYNLACLEAIGGNTEEAFTWLEGSVDAGYSDPDWMLDDTDLAVLREDARFQELVEAAAENKEADCSGSCSTGG